jgi:hypothetical protein
VTAIPDDVVLDIAITHLIRREARTRPPQTRPWRAFGTLLMARSMAAWTGRATTGHRASRRRTSGRDAAVGGEAPDGYYSNRTGKWAGGHRWNDLNDHCLVCKMSRAKFDDTLHRTATAA